ncbi:hypothetical protein EYF80_058817 [Liparis tanakae]|uniref:Uncharacterized protein n=1 Tax=Liparis tanakae TaxID=230148 RepID=A0A4Z2EQZ4_9TELE|nr:hypothetical protein EYF80_058817 [Liparis tanakae]
MTLAERGERVVLLSSCCSRLRRRPLKSVGGLKVRVPRYWMELKASGNRPSFLKRSWRRRSADSDDDHGGAQGGQRDVEAAAAGGRLQLPGEMFQVGVRRVAEELEEVVVEAVGVRPVDHHVADGEHLEEQACPLTLVCPFASGRYPTGGGECV